MMRRKQESNPVPILVWFLPHFVVLEISTVVLDIEKCGLVLNLIFDKNIVNFLAVIFSTLLIKLKL